MRRFAGMYKGRVTNNVDPENRRRVQVEIPALHNEGEPNLPWALVLTPVVGIGQGNVAAPLIGSEGVVSFLDGHPDYPVFMGCWLTTLDYPDAPASGYNASNHQTVVDGYRIDHVSGDRTTTTSRNHTENVALLSTFKARAREEIISGLTRKRLGSLETDVDGAAKVSVGGTTQVALENDFALDVIGRLLLNVTGSTEALLLAAAKIRAYLSSVTVQSMGGSVEMSTADPTGFTTLGKVSTGLTGVEIDGLMIALGAAATNFVALALRVDANLQALVAAFNSPAHLLSHNGPVTPAIQPFPTTASSKVRCAE